MPLNIDITQYELYQEGKAEGFAKGKAEVTEAMVTRMLSFGNLSVEEVARLIGLDIEKVKSIRRRSQS